MSWTTALTLALLAALGAAGLGWRQGLWQPPPRFDPFAPLDLQAPPDWLTGYRLARTRADPAACRAAVQRLGWSLQAVPDRSTGPGCGFENAYRVDASGVAIGAPLPLTCPMVLSMAMWERHTLQPAAERHFGRPITRLVHAGSYACRNVYHREAGARSEHATAAALDVTGFVLEGGRRISVLRDWDDPGAAGPFLREAHRGACRWFGGTLGPDHNAAHADHFHLQQRGRFCR